MKIMLISDIHSNFEALKKIKLYIDKVDKVFCLGDILGYHCEVNEVIDFLKKEKIICILGNHDRYIISKEDIKNKNESVLFGLDYAKKHISRENLEWLKNLPTSISYILEDGSSIFCCHGSPWDATEEYLYSNLEEKLKSLEEFNYNILAFGHTHRKYLKKTEDRKIILNPGSIGQARDKKGYVCFSIIDTEDLKVEDIELSYEYQKIINLALKNGAKEYIYKHF